MQGRVVWLVGAGAVAAAVVAGFVLVGGAIGASTAETVLATFSTHGSYSWTVPAGVKKISFDVFGASGGNVADGKILVSEGGPGGEAKGQFTVKPGEVFEVVVGGRGGDGGVDANGLEGFNGGGWGSYPASTGATGGGAGGGGSDVRIGGFGNTCASSKSCSYSDRIVVGGGGGGGGASSNGASGGGVKGGDGGVGGYDSLGGRQEGPPWQGGEACPNYDAWGCFGDGGRDSSTPGDGGGGGGGGWYGGTANGGTNGTGGASGGSGYVSPQAHHPVFPGGTRVGDGEVIISTP